MCHRLCGPVVAAVLMCCALTVPMAAAPQQLELSSLPKRNQDFANVLLAIYPDYRFVYERQRERPFGKLYLLSSVPIVPTEGPPPSDVAYLKVERPTTAVVSSFLHERSNSPTPRESVLVRAQLVDASMLRFACQLFAGGRVDGPTVCEGRFSLKTGSLEFQYIDLLFDKMEDRILKQPSEGCVNDLYQAERERNACSKEGPVDNLRCSMAAKLYARHQCRMGPGL